MAVINVPVTDNFEAWRQKTNSIATNVGDLTALNTTDKSSAVSAVNEVLTTVATISVAMSIALG